MQMIDPSSPPPNLSNEFDTVSALCSVSRLTHSELQNHTVDLNPTLKPTSDLFSSQLHSGSSEAEEENDPDGAYAFRRKAGCQYYAVRTISHWSPSYGNALNRFFTCNEMIIAVRFGEHA